MDRSQVVLLRGKGARSHFLTPVESDVGNSSVDLLLTAPADTDWVHRKVATKFNVDVAQRLKKAVYAAGQAGRRWFSGGGELSERQASAILDYAVLVELLLACRDDLGDYRDDLVDCREQLSMQISRYTEGQPERVAERVNDLVGRVRRQWEDRQDPRPRS